MEGGLWPSKKTRDFYGGSSWFIGSRAVTWFDSFNINRYLQLSNLTLSSQTIGALLQLLRPFQVYSINPNSVLSIFLYRHWFCFWFNSCWFVVEVLVVAVLRLLGIPLPEYGCGIFAVTLEPTVLLWSFKMTLKQKLGAI